MFFMGVEIFTLITLISLVVLTAVLFVLYKEKKLKRFHISLILIDIFLFLRFILIFMPSREEKHYLYLHVISLIVLSLALIQIFVKGFIHYFLEKKQNIIVPKIMQDFLQIVAFVVISIIILQEYLKLDTSILVTSSVLSIVIGLALQDTLGNFFAGLALQMQRPLEAGDWVQINDKIGMVTEIDWRAIRLRTLTRDYYNVPNSEIAKVSFMNFSKPTRLHRIDIPMGVHYKDPPNVVKKVLLEIVKDTPDVLDKPEPTVLLVNYNDFSIDYELRVFTEKFHRYKEITDDIYTKIWYQFKRHGFVIPFPIRDVYMHEVKEENECERINKIVDLLKEVDFLSVLQQPDLMSLAKGIKIDYFAAGETVISQSEEGDTFYIIREGLLEVSHIDKQGEKTLLSELSSPSFFGELSLLTGSARTATVKALEDCKLFTIDSETFKAVLMSNPDLMKQISDIITRRQTELEIAGETTHELRNIDEEIEEKSNSLLRRMKNFFRL